MELNFFSHAHIQSKNHQYAAVFNLKQAISLAKTKEIFASCEKSGNGEICLDKKKELKSQSWRTPFSSYPITALKIETTIKSANSLKKAILKENTKNSFKCLVGSRRVSERENLESKNIQLTIHEQNLLTKIAIVIKKSPKGVCFLSTERLAESIGKKKAQTCLLINKLISLNLVKLVGKRGHNRVYELTDLAKNNPKFFIKKETFERTKQAKKLYVFAKKIRRNFNENQTKTIELMGSFKDIKKSSKKRVSKKKKDDDSFLHKKVKRISTKDLQAIGAEKAIEKLAECMDQETKDRLAKLGLCEFTFLKAKLDKILIQGYQISDLAKYIKQCAFNHKIQAEANLTLSLEEKAWEAKNTRDFELNKKQVLSWFESKGCHVRIEKKGDIRKFIVKGKRQAEILMHTVPAVFKSDLCGIMESLR